MTPANPVQALADRLRQAHRAAFVVPGADRAERVRLTLRAAIAPSRRIAIDPEFPNAWQVLLKIAALNGYQLAGPTVRSPDLGVHFTGDKAEAVACELPSALPVINRHCLDISKSHVARVFESVFGYGLAVDPTTYEGSMVEKSDSNATHDGRILDGPILPDEVREGYVYQRLVETTKEGVGGKLAVDLRTPLYGGRAVHVYLKRRSADERFLNRNASVEILDSRDVFSADELRQLAAFAEAMGLDYGEADVLRDRESQRIYVVDVANTPAGPPNGLSPFDARRAVENLSVAFDRLCDEVVHRHRGSTLAPSILATVSPMHD